MDATQPPAGARIPGMPGRDPVLHGTSIVVRPFPTDSPPTRARRITSRSAQRRGAGARGPLLPPEVPRWKSRSGSFDHAVLEAFAPIDQLWHAQLAKLDVAADTVPRMQLRPGQQWPPEVVAEGPVPLGRLIPAGVDRNGHPTRARMVLFRQPLAHRVSSQRELVDLIFGVLTELVAVYLDISPDAVADGP